jgi:hypothetical protein
MEGEVMKNFAPWVRWVVYIGVVLIIADGIYWIVK